MATTATLPRIVTEPERTAKTRFARVLASIHSLAYVAQDARRALGVARARLSALDSVHPEYATANTRLIVQWWSYVAALAFVLALDMVLSAPTATYYATRYAHLDPLGIKLACVLLPTGLFLLELTVAGQRLAAAERAIEGLPAAFWGWSAVGLLIVLVVSAFIASTQLAIASVSSSGLAASATKLRVIGVTATAIVLHGVVAFGGKAMHDAKGYALYAVKAARLNQKASRAESESSQAERRAVTLFTTYRGELQDFNTLHPEARLSEGPLQKVAVDLINGQSGVPTGAPPATEAPGSGPSAPGAPPIPNRPTASAAGERPTAAVAPGREGGPQATPSDQEARQTGGGASDARAREADAEVVA